MGYRKGVERILTLGSRKKTDNRADKLWDDFSMDNRDGKQRKKSTFLLTRNVNRSMPEGYMLKPVLFNILKTIWRWWYSLK